jgi:predicted CXXCH cytochrome family protein
VNKFLQRALLIVLVGILAIPAANAARQSRIKDTKHNLSTSGPGTTKSGTESQICVFCHTPHGANTADVSPLWNRPSSGASYVPYSSESLDAISAQGGWTGQPLGSSKLCLSCHDGTIALGNVVNAPGSGLGSAISVSGSTTTTMPVGAGATSGYTRLLGANLTNDHPISVTYNKTLTDRDGELRTPDAQQRVMGGTMTINGSHPLVGPRATGQGSGIGSSTAGTGLYGSISSRPVLPLENTTGLGSGTGQVQCTTCHDPHLKESTLTNDATDKADILKERNIKFLRRPRFQMAQPTNTYSDGNDIMCLACHDKGMQGNGNSWAYSSHANSNIATQTYSTTAADTREFPQGMPVWKVSCLNCHDTHTVSGARRLTRSGGNGSVSTLEETCYQCHSTAGGATPIISPTTSVPDIGADFARTYRMPITTADQKSGTERHDIGGNFNDAFDGGAGTTGSDCSGTTNKCGADFVERREYLGKGTETTNRHVECTDCHNPHRVVRHHLYSGLSGNITGTQTDKEGTHTHVNDGTTLHTNLASGVLRGAWGVEPSYGSNSFHTTATNFTVRRGDPGADFVLAAPNSALTPGYDVDSKAYVTREYQICLKCHSTYGYNSPPNLDNNNNDGLTPSGTNSLSQYTDQAKEFQSPASHANESTSDSCPGANCIELGNDGGAVGAGLNRHNHRSWHPVMRATGRTATKRDLTATDAFRQPWSNAVGTQTMYCSDCHGSSTGSTTVIPDGTVPSTGAGSAWGPHGSSLPFILKGTWDNDTGYTTKSGTASTTNALCLKCHTPLGSTGFNNSSFSNLHQHHQDKIERLECTWCHVAVPHGWKNKALLVNLNDVGAEAGQGDNSSKEVSINVGADYYTQGPYYLEAKNKVISFSRSGEWAENSCGSAGKSGTGLATGRINSTNGQTNNRAGSGKNWMTNMCQTGVP